jgi:hypothetical protein
VIMGITWAPGVTCHLTQRYLIGDPRLLPHLDAESHEWLRKQPAEDPIAWLKVPDDDYPEGWRAVPVAAVGERP